MRKISYDPLFKELVDVKMNRTELAKKASISKGTMTKSGKNEYVAMEFIQSDLWYNRISSDLMSEMAPSQKYTR